MAVPRNRMLLFGAVVVAAGSLWRAAAGEGEKRQLAQAHAQLQQMTKQLEAERAQLSQELASARQTLKEQAGGLKGLRQQLAQATTELTSLQHQYDRTVQDNTKLTNQLSASTTEKQQLEAKLSSVKELKLALRDVQRKLWRDRWAAWRAHIDSERQGDQERLALGNQGYLMRNGLSTITSSSRPRLQVRVLDPQLQ